MKYILLFTYFIAFVTSISGQTVQVINAQTGHPVENVLVATKNYTTQTDKNGQVNLINTGNNESVQFQHSSFIKFITTKEKIIARGNIVLLEESPIRLDEIVISANRWEQEKTEIPLKIKHIGAEEVLRNQPQTTADMLGSTGGVFIQKSQMGGGSPMIRGFSANRILLVVDGIRMNNAIYRSGNLHNIISLDVNSLENTEIIFGPGSVIYGSDALGGVISFNTLSPRLSTSEEAEQLGKFITRISSANSEKMFHGNLNFGKKKWAVLMGATFSGFGDLRMGAHGPDEYLRKEYVMPGKKPENDQIIQNRNPQIQSPTGYNQLNAMGKFRFRPSEKIDFRLGVHHSQTSDIPRYDRLVVYKNNALQYAQWYYGPQKWSLISGKLDYRAEHIMFDKLSLLSGYQTYTESRNDRTLFEKKIRQRQENLQIFSVNLDMMKTLEKYHELFYGTEAFFNNVESTGISENISTGERNSIATRYPDGSDYKSLGSYVSWKFKFRKKLILQAGARFTHTQLSGTFDPEFYRFSFNHFNMKNSAFNGNAGVAWHPAPDWQINISASTGFRSPNIDDVAKVFDSEPGNVVVPNPNLKPEYAKNIEAGIIRNFAGNAKLELTSFITHLKDAMVRRNFSVNGLDSLVYDGILSKVEALVNAESATIYGGNISFDYLFTSTLRTRHEFTIVRGIDSDGYPLRHVPPDFGSSHLFYENQKWFFDVFVEYSRKFDFEQLAPDEQDKPYLYAIDEIGNPWSPAWWTLNFKFKYKFNQNIILSSGCENIFNNRYRPYSSGIVASGINFFLSLGVEF